MPSSIEYYECCLHCGDNGCGAEDRHRFPCNKCQPRIIAPPLGYTTIVKEHG